MMREIQLEDIRLETLSEANQASDFDCRDADLNDFLLNDALRYQDACVSMTVLAKHGDKVIGFFSLGMDCISLKSNESREMRHEHNLHLKEYPALKIHRLAVADGFQGSGVGRYLVLFVMGFARESLQTLVGVRFLSVDAYEASVDFYQKLDFLNNKHKEERGKQVDEEKVPCPKCGAPMGVCCLNCGVSLEQPEQTNDGGVVTISMRCDLKPIVWPEESKLD